MGGVSLVCKYVEVLSERDCTTHALFLVMREQIRIELTLCITKKERSMKKKVLFYALIITLLSSCIPSKKVAYLTGDYNINTSVETDKSFDEVRDKVIDYFSVNGIAISTLEKNSGLIVSNKVSLRDYVTTEKNGKPSNSGAFVVIPYEKNIVYMNATSDFNVRVKQQNGKVSVAVNLPNIVAERTLKPTMLQMISTPERVEAKSTGVFERGLLDLFK